MLANVLQADELEELKAERRGLRVRLTATNNNAAAGLSVDMTNVTDNFSRLAVINASLIEHYLSSGDYAAAELETKEHGRYSQLVKEIREVNQPQRCNLKPIEVKLPKVVVGDVASWIGFREALETVICASNLSEEEKTLQLLTALPASEQIHVRGRTFEQAVEKLKERFESPEVLMDTVRAQFKSVAKAAYPSEGDRYRAISSVLSAVIGLSSRDEIRLEAFNCTIQLLPRPVYWTYVHTKGTRDLQDLIEFLKNQIKGLSWLESAAGTDRGFLKSPVQHKFQPKQQQSKQSGQTFAKQQQWRAKAPLKVNNVAREESGSEDDNKSFDLYPRLYDLMAVRRPKSNDAIFIKGTINGQPISFLWDPGAVKTLLPANLFPDEPLEERFSSATGHPILASAPIVTKFTVNGTPLQIEVHANSSGLALLGRPFTRKCSVFSDGEKVVKMVYHHKGVDTIVYQCKPAAKPQAEGQHTDDIYAVLPCALEDDLLFEEEEEQTTTTTTTPPELKKVLAKWAHLGEGLGETDLVNHRLYVKPGTRPITMPNRLLPVRYQAKADEAVAEMIKLGVIRESTSAWCSAVVPVKKKDGSIRIAIDYRQLNEVCAKDAYPMPRIDQIISKLSGASVFSTLDLKKGYYQVRMHPEDAEKTAFRFGRKLYEFTRMPFGLSSAPQTFMRLMNRVLEPFPFAECYLDDVIIFSSNLKEHGEHLQKVLAAIEAANLRLNLKKCRFGLEEVDYLGFTIGKNRRRPSEDKVSKLRNFPSPSTKKELMTFIGIANQYRELVADFAAKSSLLFELNKQTKNKAPLIWRPEHEAVFAALKKELTSPPVVTLADDAKPFIVKVDASGTGIGAVLLQEDDRGRKQVVEYASQSFKGPQLRYPTIEKEATAIDFALKKWRHFLIGGRFRLETDHRPLKWLRSMKDTNGKLGRMAMRIAQFEPFDVVHIPGKENVEADYLSRLVSVINLDYSDRDDVFFRQQKKASDFTTDAKGRWFFIGDGNNRLAVPRKHRGEVLKALHDDYGHLSSDRVLSMARSRVWWPRMADDVKEYIRACKRCALNKDVPIRKTERKSTVIEVSEPFERWHVDVIESITLASARGHRCIFVAQDAFSKWPIALPAKKCTAATIISWVKSAILDKFGKPKQIMTDHGSVFGSKEFAEFLRRENIEHLTSAIYHHETNGVVERFNRTLEEMIRTNCAQSADWDREVNKCLTAYQTTVHKSTRRAPYEVVYGKRPSLPIDELLGVQPPRSQETREQIHEEVRKRIRETAAKEKEKYDKRNDTTWRDLHRKKVYWRDFQANPKEGKHFAPRFKGPFLAERTGSRWNYRITDSGGKSKVVNANQLKECHSDEPLATGLRGRGRPPTRIQTILVYPSNR